MELSQVVSEHFADDLFSNHPRHLVSSYLLGNVDESLWLRDCLYWNLGLLVLFQFFNFHDSLLLLLHADAFILPVVHLNLRES